MLSCPYLDQFGHFLHCDGAISIDIKHTENLLQNFLWGSLVHDEARREIFNWHYKSQIGVCYYLLDQHELGKVNVAIAVGVIDSEHMFHHFLSIFPG